MKLEQLTRQHEQRQASPPLQHSTHPGGRFTFDDATLRFSGRAHKLCLALSLFYPPPPFSLPSRSLQSFSFCLSVSFSFCLSVKPTPAIFRFFSFLSLFTLQRNRQAMHSLCLSLISSLSFLLQLSLSPSLSLSLGLTRSLTL